MARKTMRRLAPAAVLGALATVVSAQGPSGPQQGAVFRATTNYVSTDVKVQDKQGQFVSDLQMNEFRVYEDNVPQKIATFSQVIGGRILTSFGGTAPTAAPSAGEGLILPPTRPPSDISGRIFVIFIDDLHFTRFETPRVRQLLEKVRDTLIRDNDLVAFMSSGPSDIEVNPVYDFEHRRFNETIQKVQGRALTADEVVQGAAQETKDGPEGLRFYAHTAFAAAYDMLEQLGQIKDRRKSFIYISDGYSFDPYNESRFKQMEKTYESVGSSSMDDPNQNQSADANPDDPSASSTTPKTKQSDLSPWDSLADPAYRQRTMFAEGDLEREIAQLVHDARRNNVAFYAIDPRGLDTTFMDATTTADITSRDRMIQATQTQGTLRVLSDETGGFCICNENEITEPLQRIDNETSNYYIIGYVTNNPDPFKLRRTIRIEVTRPGVNQLVYRDSYTIPRPSRK
jgi:VWFA-related protein